MIREIKMLIGVMLIALLATLVGATFVRAAGPVSGYRITTVLNVDTDSSMLWPDSVVIYYAAGSYGGDADSMRSLSTSICECEGMAAPDSLCRYALLSPTAIGGAAGYNPSAVAYWYYDGPNDKIIRDNSPQISHTMMYVDTVDQILEAIGGVAGAGANPCTLYVRDTLNDAWVVGADIMVRSVDTATIAAGPLSSNVNGFAVFSLDDGTYPARAQLTGYYMQTAYEAIPVSGSHTDTIQVYPFTPTLPASGDDSSILVIYTDEAYATAKITMHGLGRGNSDKPVRDTNGVFLDRNEIRPNPQADSNGIIQVTLVRSKACVPRAGYDIVVRDVRNRELFRVMNYAVPDSSQVVLRDE